MLAQDALPGYESVQAQELAETAFPQASGATVIGVVKRADGAPLTDADTQRVQQLAIIAFSAMLLASPGFFTTLGPSLAVALMLLAALTLIPALLALIGPRVFWPSKSWQRPPKASVFGRLGRLVARRPVLVALVSGAVVVALAAGTLGFRQNYDFVSQLPSDTESRRAFTDLQSGFPAEALDAVEPLRDAAPPGTTVLVGGTTSATASSSPCCCAAWSRPST